MHPRMGMWLSPDDASSLRLVDCKQLDLEDQVGVCRDYSTSTCGNRLKKMRLKSEAGEYTSGAITIV